MFDCRLFNAWTGDDDEILKVVDIIEYDIDGLIKSLRAYKG